MCTLSRIVALHCCLSIRSIFGTQCTYFMPVIRCSGFVSDTSSRLESSTLTVHVLQPFIAIRMMMEQNSLSFSFTEIRISLPYWSKSFEAGTTKSNMSFDVH